MPTMRPFHGELTLIESPFKPRGQLPSDRDVDRTFNDSYTRALCRTAAFLGHKPFASHIFCTQFLDDTIEEERARGIAIGLAWGQFAKQTMVGIDRGLTDGMRLGITNAREARREIIWTSLTGFRKSPLPPNVVRDEYKELIEIHDRRLGVELAF